MKRSLMIILIAAIVLLITAGAAMAAYIFVLRNAAPSEPVAKQEAKVDEPAALEFLKTKNFTTDLADKDRLRYVDTTISLGFVDTATVDKYKKFEPQIRDIILTQLRAMVANDLIGAAGKKKLADSIQAALKPLLKDDLKGVFVTDLVVQ